MLLVLYIALVIEGRSVQAVTMRFVGSLLPTVLTKTKDRGSFWAEDRSNPINTLQIYNVVWTSNHK